MRARIIFIGLYLPSRILNQPELEPCPIRRECVWLAGIGLNLAQVAPRNQDWLGSYRIY